MARLTLGKGWDQEPPSRIDEILESGQCPKTVISGMSNNPHERVYYSQLAERPNDPKAYMTHDEARRTCDKKGYAYKPMKSAL